MGEILLRSTITRGGVIIDVSGTTDSLMCQGEPRTDMPTSITCNLDDLKNYNIPANATILTNYETIQCKNGQLVQMSDNNKVIYSPN